MNENAIVKIQPILRNMEDIERAAGAMVKSGFFRDTTQVAQAAVKIMAGSELGFGPFASMTGVHIIQNKTVLSANLLAAAIKQTGRYNFRVTKHSDTECEITFYEYFNGKWESAGVSVFDWEDAKKAQLVGKDNWQKYPRNMLFARALSNGQKWYAPDVFNGATVYTPDEMGAQVDEEGNVIDGSFAPAQPAPAPAPVFTYDEAAARLTPKGARYDSLTMEQLNAIVTSEKASADSKAAAAVVLAHDFSAESPAQ